MAVENILETRILLKYDTYEHWMNSSLILKQGEAAICTFPENRVIDQLSNSTPMNTPPAVGIKIGDGQSYFWQLPWLQAIAADVYSWAKGSIKPTYTATEISGLQSFIEDNFHISGDVTIAPRIYQLIQGTGVNAHKYYLQYKENNEEGEWIVDTNHPIDLSVYNDIYDWIGQSIIDRYVTLGDFIAFLITNRLKNISYTDTSISHQFITEVNQTNGIISVSRAQPSFSDISGTATVAQGGTGATSFPRDEVLVGNGTDNITTIPVADTVGNNDSLVTNRAIKAYVDAATAGLTGAMHFIGESTVVINPNSSVNPNIQNYDFSKVQPGDVILYNSKEFVWDGAQWTLLGDEGSYAVKGSIKDSDIAVDAAIQQSKIAGLDTTFNTKVDKVEGKSLTSNDFTDELKEKLENIDSGAEVNTIEHILVNGTEYPPGIVNQVPKTVNLLINEFDTASQQKLTNIEARAEVNKIQKIVYDGVELTPDENRVVTITSDPHTEHENRIEQIFINGTEWVPNQQKQVRILIDQAALNLNVLEGATIPNGQGGTQDVTQVSKKLELERIAVTGNIQDLKQTSDTYVILNCGSSTDVI